MKKILIFALAALSAGALFGGDRIAAELQKFDASYGRDVLKEQANHERMRIASERSQRSRSAVEPRFDEAVVEEFVASKDVAAADKMTKLRQKYPRAYQRMGDVDEFSYFGFKLYDVKIGKADLEDFLKEYEAYLSQYN